MLASLPDGGTDPQWLREQYQDRQRSLKDIAAETGTPGRNPRRRSPQRRHPRPARHHRPHPPTRRPRRTRHVPTDVWNAFTHPGAEQRTAGSSPSPASPASTTPPASSASGTPTTSQLRQLETTVGTPLLRTRPDGQLTLTAYGQLFARDVRPALESLAQSRKSRDGNHGTLSLASPGTVHLPRQPARRELFNYNETPSSWRSSTRDPYRLGIRSFEQSTGYPNAYVNSVGPI